MSVSLKTEADKTSYCLGMDIGSSFRKLPIKVNIEAAAQGMKDVFSGGALQIDQDEFVLPMLPPGGCIEDIITETEGGDK